MERKRKHLLVSFLVTMLLVGCQGNNPSTSSSNTSNGSPGDVFTNDYYNEANFIESSETVTETKVVLYDGPSYLKSMEGVSIKVNDNPLFVYETRVNHLRQFTWGVPDTKEAVSVFDFEGKVHIEITLDDENVQSAYVSPLVYGISPAVAANKISFDLEYANNYVVQYVGNSGELKAIHLFASPLEKDVITEEQAKNDDSIIYIGPGVYKADAIPVKSNSTIYIAGGAYVYGQIRAEGLENITIRGRGIISGSLYTRSNEADYTIPVEIRTSNNVKIEDLTFLDPAGWTIALYKSKDVELNNVKIISARQNGDGISVQSCENVKVNGGFVRTWDDSLVVKNVDRGSTKSVHFDGVSVWTDLAQSMEVGYETYGPTMDDIKFENITVIHNYHKAAISMHNCDDADITNVTYKNITIEDAAMLGDNQTDGENDFFIDFTIAYNVEWTKSEGIRGTVDGINIDNVKVYKMEDSIVSRMLGESNESSIKNVAISNIEIENKKISNLNDLHVLNNDYVKNLTYKNDADVLGAKIKLPYKLALTNETANVTKVDNIAQDGMLVPDFARSNGEISYIGVPAKANYEVSATHGAGSKTTTPADDGSGDYTLAGYQASSAIDNNLETTWKSKEWKNEADEFVALTIDFDKAMEIGVIRLFGKQDNDFFFTYDIQVWGRKAKADGTATNYIRLAGTKEYQMSPGNANCIDINITTQQYTGLQLRLYRSEKATAASYYEIANIEFYPPSLSFNKAIVESTEHNDVYNVEKMVDGDPTGTSYYESKTLPATIVIDLGDVYKVNTFVLSLPPSLMWDARTQVIEILASDSNLAYNKNTTEFKTVVEQKGYLFDPATGNRNIITIEETPMRYIKIVITSNDIKGGYNAQLSEFSVYGEQ